MHSKVCPPLTHSKSPPTSHQRGLDTLTLLSGPDTGPLEHARLRKVTLQSWTLEMPTHMGRWEQTGIRASRLEVLDTLVTQFSWTLAAIA